MISNLQFDRTFFQDLWRLTKPYWTSEEKGIAYSLLLFNVLCIVGQLIGNIGYNQFHRDFFNALQNVNQTAIIASLKYLAFNITLLLVSTGSSIYFSGLLSTRWRRWLTHYYLQKWLAHQKLAPMQATRLCEEAEGRRSNPELYISGLPRPNASRPRKDEYIDNPDQRISEDLEKFPTLTLSLLFGPYQFLHSLLMLIVFGVILWNLSHDLSFGAAHFTIPGFLCWIALSYAVLGTWGISKIGKKLAFFDYEQQRFNADFRFKLIELRQVSGSRDQVAGRQQDKQLQNDQTDSTINEYASSFNHIFRNTLKIVSVNTRLTFFNKSYNFFSYMIGLAISMPFYLAKQITLGSVMQISSAYNVVVSGFSAFIDSFSDLAQWRSVVHRLAELDASFRWHDIAGYADTLTAGKTTADEETVGLA